MEALLQGMAAKRNRFLAAVENSDSKHYISVIALVGVSFLLGRAVLLDAILPCGIALISILVSRGKGNIYLLPFILLGTLTHYSGKLEIGGDMVAALLCGVVFFVLKKRKLSIGYVALIAMCVTIVTKVIFLAWGTIMIEYDVMMIAAEAVIVVGLVYLFEAFFCLKSKRTAGENGEAQGVISVAVMSMLTVSGLGLFPVEVGVALFITLLMGFKLGITEGAISGIGTGAVVVLTLSGTPAVLGVLAFCGMIAGMFLGLSRMVAATVFAAVCIGFGLIKGAPDFYIPVLDPLIAAGIFAVIPKRLMNQIELVLARFRKEAQYEDLVGNSKCKKILEEYRDTFNKLSTVYGKNRSNDDLIPMQFKALSRLTGTMIKQLEYPANRMDARTYRYHPQVGVSAYAKEENICGDSYQCAELKKGKFMLALSDGMGKGRRAAEESSKTLSALHNLLKVGFDIELALRTVNALLINNTSDEIFSTVDLGIFDGFTGKLQLYKIGAAATFIKRGTQVEAIKVATLPIGMIDKISVEYIDVQLRKGDKIILVSDGVTDADREGGGGTQWLIEAIAKIASNDPGTISDLIINRAVEKYGVKEKDDMTVITVDIQ
ncbi:MAG: SpoIIE family protein phosphatase [Anaerovorax sp.]